MGNMVRYEDTILTWPELVAKANAVGLQKAINSGFKSASWHLVLDDRRTIGPVPASVVKKLDLPDLTTSMQYAVIEVLMAENAATKASANLSAVPLMSSGYTDVLSKSDAAQRRLADAKAAYRALKATA